MNKVLLTGRLTRDPEMRGLASGKNVTTFTVASNEFIGGGEKAEYQVSGKVYPRVSAGLLAAPGGIAASGGQAAAAVRLRSIARAARTG